MTTSWPLLDEVDLSSEPPSLQASPLLDHQEITTVAVESFLPPEPVSMSLKVQRFHVRTSSLNANKHTIGEPLPAFSFNNISDHSSTSLPTNTKEDFQDQEADAETVWQEELEDDYEEPEMTRSRSNSSSSTAGSENSATVAWSELEKAEEAEAREEGSDEATAFLLARLEQENKALAANPKFNLRRARSRKQSRPPSFQMLKRLVQDQNNAASTFSLPASPMEQISETSRFSVTQEPPPMTELEFWTALVQDYTKTAQRLPTLTSSKIKSGVPPPLRGVVWVSMAGARDVELGGEFEKLSEEPSPYENLIGKDVGRSFPGVEMFRDPEGEGQQMLGRVLKCFSLYDKEIGYCQGLGFLVGPLLMHMGDKDAFCVLVRLMENYDLRSCFLPSLSGLHVRVFQFQRLLTQHLPNLAAHLASLQVEAAYLAQWFLSFFAVTCPLPMLFRIYDVIFAEGASETIMRVALSLMRRNEFKLMACTEFEEVMHILLSRALWDTYACNADDMVTDFMGMTGVVTRQSLDSLAKAFKDAQSGETPAWFAFLPDASAAASKFLGRMWAPSTPAKQTGLAPGPARSFRPTSFLRRSPSASSFTTNDPSSDSYVTLTTDATTVGRGSPPASIMIPVPHSVSKEDKDLHSQIEDLLTALSEQQRQSADIMAELQREREERTEDHLAFQELIKHVNITAITTTSLEQRRRTLPHPSSTTTITQPQPTPELNAALTKATARVLYRRTHHRASSVFETKQRLRDSLLRSREQLDLEQSRSAALTRQLDDQEAEYSTIREQLRDAQTRLQDGLRDKQKLEQAISTMQRTRSRSSVTWSEPDTPPIPTIRRSDTTDSRLSLMSVASGHGSGLREFRLARSDSVTAKRAPPTPPTPVDPATGLPGLPRRGASLVTQSILSTEDHAPAEEDTLLVELVNAKTSEAVARQELEEVKAKLDAMRKMLGVPGAPGVGGMGGTPLKQMSGTESRLSPVTPPPTTPATSAGGGGFWGWGKRSVSGGGN